MLRGVVIVVVFLLAAVVGAAGDLPFALPVPDGWRTETIPFPLGFAPELAYEGLEELRFAPGMFDAGADDFWTYAFVWWIAADTVPGADQLAADLVVYFDGLMRAVAEDDVFEAGTTAHLQAMPSPFSTGEPSEYEGSVTTVDAFATDEPVTLNVRVHWRRCADAGRLAIIFELSPQPPGPGIWHDLAAIRDGFRCRD